MQKIIITIDGYSSCGKSTLARQLAEKLSYVFIDSGAMYRAITLYFIRHRIDSTNEKDVKNAISNIQLHFIFNKESGVSDVYLNAENVAAEIRSMEVNNRVSEVSAIEQVRRFAVSQQQKMGEKKGIVMDGRDIGTTVFPNAELKIFMTADMGVRAQRRFDELKMTMPDITLDEVRANLEKRDRIDTTRTISPLKKAEDAVTLDNSELTTKRQLEIALNWAKEKGATC